MERLDWDNYLVLQDKIDKLADEEPFSALSFLMWKYYGFDFKFEVNHFGILMYSKIDIETRNYITIKNENCKLCWMINHPYLDYDSAIDFIDLFKHQQKTVIKLNNGCNDVLYDNLLESELDKLKLEPSAVIKIGNWNSNYIYNLAQMYQFPGKKMQKKRNHYNYYIKNFAVDSVVKNIKDVDSALLSQFLNKSIIQYETNGNKAESEIYQYLVETEMFKSDRYVGSVLYYKNEIIGITLGFIHGQYFEVVIERAKKDIRGSFQYLISNNIKMHQTALEGCLYMDREDDAGISELDYSKRSYQPIKIYKRVLARFN